MGGKRKQNSPKKKEEALEIEGVQYISYPCPERKGGGAAISLLAGDFSLTRLDIIVPKNLKIVWGIVSPKVSTQDFKGILVCSFYSAPYNRRKTQRIQHIAINEELKARYKDFYFLAGGHKNYLNL